MKTKLWNDSESMPRKEYPRPQWVRDNWYCLNGNWEFAFDFGKSGEARGMMDADEFPMSIIVPFCPESKLSGIEYTDFIPAVWYRRTLTFSKLPEGRAILHFGAVDYYCKVWVNGVFCGSHKGGFTSFEMDITKAMHCGENTIVVYAEDDLRSGRQARGKQCKSFYSCDCNYTRTTGIYQTVWLELVPERYLKGAKMTPHAKDGVLDICVNAENAKDGDLVRVTAMYHGNVAGTATAQVCNSYADARISVDEIHLWNPGLPELYDMTVELLDGVSGEVIDTVGSYFALRDVSLTKRALTVNGRPVFMRMVLDQGFNPDGIYTAPTDGCLKRDIELSMSLGFNGARFHERVFEDRSLYWADRLGYLVWGEHAMEDKSSAQGFCDFLPEWMETIKQYYNHPSVIGWMCANETYHSWEKEFPGVAGVYHVTKMLDPYRPVIDASGGVHGKTDMFDVHDYEQDPEKLAEYLKPMSEDENAFHSPIERYRGKGPLRDEYYDGQPYWISECGGTLYNANHEAVFGYGMVETEDEFAKRYEGLIEVMASHPRVCGFCYTQLTDVEYEQNGLFYYDRTPKFSNKIYERISAANRKVSVIEKE